MGLPESQANKQVTKVLMMCQDYLRFTNNSTGKAVYKNDDGTIRTVKYGWNGSGDKYAVAKPDGRYISIELKSSTGKLREIQENWGKMIESLGGIYIKAKGKNAAFTVANTLMKEKIIPYSLYQKILLEI